MSVSNSKLKRKRVVLTIDDKLAVCEMVKKNINKDEIMAKFNITRQTTNDICKSKDSFKQFKKAKLELGTSSKLTSRKSMKSGSYKELDSALYMWFRQKRELGIPVTGEYSLLNCLLF